MPKLMLEEEVGVNFVDSPAALERWRAAGASVLRASVSGSHAALAESCAKRRHLSLCNTRATLSGVSKLAANPLVDAPVYGPPFVRDRDGGRRYATLADFQKFVNWAICRNVASFWGTVCEPTDVPVNKRHLDMLLAHMVYSDKPFMGSVTEPSRAQDSSICAKFFWQRFCPKQHRDDLADQYQQPAHV